MTFHPGITSDDEAFYAGDTFLISNEDMILALTGQFKQLSHEPEKLRWLNGIRTNDLCEVSAVL